MKIGVVLGLYEFCISFYKYYRVNVIDKNRYKGFG